MIIQIFINIFVGLLLIFIAWRAFGEKLLGSILDYLERRKGNLINRENLIKFLEQYDDFVKYDEKGHAKYYSIHSVIIPRLKIEVKK